MLHCRDVPGLIPPKLGRPAPLDLLLCPNVMVKAPSSSWCRRFCSVKGRSLG